MGAWTFVPYTALAVPKYNKQRRRLAKGVAARLDAAQAAILQDPHRGDRKKEQLRDVWVEKLKADHDQWLVAYEIDPKARTVTFLAIGQHENFYRDLKRFAVNGPGRRASRLGVDRDRRSIILAAAIVDDLSQPDRSGVVLEKYVEPETVTLTPVIVGKIISAIATTSGPDYTLVVRRPDGSRRTVWVGRRVLRTVPRGRLGTTVHAVRADRREVG